MYVENLSNLDRVEEVEYCDPGTWDCEYLAATLPSSQRQFKMTSRAARNFGAELDIIDSAQIGQ